MDKAEKSNGSVICLPPSGVSQISPHLSPHAETLMPFSFGQEEAALACPDLGVPDPSSEGRTQLLARTDVEKGGGNQQDEEKGSQKAEQMTQCCVYRISYLSSELPP